MSIKTDNDANNSHIENYLFPRHLYMGSYEHKPCISAHIQVLQVLDSVYGQIYTACAHMSPYTLSIICITIL